MNHVVLLIIMSTLFFMFLFISILIMYNLMAYKRPSGHFNTITTPHAITPLCGLIMQSAIKPSESVLYQFLLIFIRFNFICILNLIDSM